jgi:hypothetical protein
VVAAGEPPRDGAVISVSTDSGELPVEVKKLWAVALLSTLFGKNI